MQAVSRASKPPLSDPLSFISPMVLDFLCSTAMGAALRYPSLRILPGERCRSNAVAPSIRTQGPLAGTKRPSSVGDHRSRRVCCVIVPPQFRHSNVRVVGPLSRAKMLGTTRASRIGCLHFGQRGAPSSASLVKKIHPVYKAPGNHLSHIFFHSGAVQTGHRLLRGRLAEPGAMFSVKKLAGTVCMAEECK
jgi:hypothetical protein